MKKILLITPLYPGDDMPKTDTPIVHYFAREWVKDGYQVQVMFLPAVFPSLYYRIASVFKEAISSKVGFGIRTDCPKDKEYKIDGVPVKQIGIRKYVPHTLPANSVLNEVTKKIIDFCQYNTFEPDYVIGHFANPTLEIMNLLKSQIDATYCYVAHSAVEASVYGNRAMDLFGNLDSIGFRSRYIQHSFYARYEVNIPSFMCYSGIPESFVEQDVDKRFSKISNFLYVGTLISRKYPSALIPAISRSFGKEPFVINYIGSGKESDMIQKEAEVCGCQDQVHLLGRLTREEVRQTMDESDVFIMISKGETFGLVYLEAMARGLITVASKKEGFDGIIQDGVNGFLCEAGNVDELTSIIDRIRTMSIVDLEKISKNAYSTAKELTDRKAARLYINHVAGLDRFNKGCKMQ